MQDISLASVMGAMTAQSQSKRSLCSVLDNGVPAVKYVSIENVENANAKGIKKSIEEAFQGLGVTSLENRLVGINISGASVNIGKCGIAKLLKELLP